MNELLYRMSEDLLARVGGPMTFRLLLQPIMAAILAIRDGREDARAGRRAYFALVLLDPEHRWEQLLDAWRQAGRVATLALAMDLIYQLLVIRWFYFGEALIVVLCLAILPYVLVRGLANRLSRRNVAITDISDDVTEQPGIAMPNRVDAPLPSGGDGEQPVVPS